MLDPEAFAGNGHEQVDGDGSPDLRADRLVGGSEEALDAQVVLDPPEEVELTPWKQGWRTTFGPLRRLWGFWRNWKVDQIKGIDGLHDNMYRVIILPTGAQAP